MKTKKLIKKLEKMFPYSPNLYLWTRHATIKERETNTIGRKKYYLVKKAIKHLSKKLKNQIEIEI